MQDYQQRVIQEKQELDVKRDALAAFLQSDKSQSVPTGELARLVRQTAIMEEYSGVLAERILNFPPE